MRRKWIVGAAFTVIAVALMLMVHPTGAQVKKGKTRIAETKYLMRGIVKATCGGLGKLLKGDGPKDDKAWEAAACYASCLNEMGHVLMADKRCPDAAWAGAAKTLRGCSEVALKAIQKKDLAGAQGAFKAMLKSCAGCHKAHK